MRYSLGPVMLSDEECSTKLVISHVELLLIQQELPAMGIELRVLALWQKGFPRRQQAQDAQRHDHVPDGVDDVVVLLGLQECIAHQSSYYQSQAKGHPNREVSPRRKKLPALGAAQAPAGGDQADSGEGWRQENP